MRDSRWTAEFSNHLRYDTRGMPPYLPSKQDGGSDGFGARYTRGE